MSNNKEINKENPLFGGLAQLARAPALHAGGQRFESVILHQSTMDKEQSSKLKVQRVIVRLGKRA